MTQRRPFGTDAVPTYGIYRRDNETGAAQQEAQTTGGRYDKAPWTTRQDASVIVARCLTASRLRYV